MGNSGRDMERGRDDLFGGPVDAGAKDKEKERKEEGNKDGEPAGENEKK